MKKFLQMIRIVFLTFLIFSLENCSKEAEVERKKQKKKKMRRNEKEEEEAKEEKRI